MVQPVLPFPGPLLPAPAAEKKPLTAAQESDIFLLSQDKYITFDGVLIISEMILACWGEQPSNTALISSNAICF